MRFHPSGAGNRPPAPDRKNISEFGWKKQLHSGKLSGAISTETDPTVPAWAKAANKPTYTAAEVGAPTVAEMQQAIANVNTMKIHICAQG